MEERPTLAVIEGSGEDAQARAPVTRRIVDRARYCGHTHAEVDEHARRVYCQDCGGELDAFDFLVKLAHGVDRWRTAHDRAKQDAKRAERELEEIKRQVRNAKAQRRRAS